MIKEYRMIVRGRSMPECVEIHDSGFQRPMVELDGMEEIPLRFLFGAKEGFECASEMVSVDPRTKERISERSWLRVIS